MAAKRFHIETPEQLQALAQYAQTADGGTLIHIACIWKAAKQKDVHTYWDHCVFIGFTDDRRREAAVVRQSEERPVVVARMKYAIALKWCALHLSQAI